MGTGLPSQTCDLCRCTGTCAQKGLMIGLVWSLLSQS